MCNGPPLVSHAGGWDIAADAICRGKSQERKMKSRLP